MLSAEPHSSGRRSWPLRSAGGSLSAVRCNMTAGESGPNAVAALLYSRYLTPESAGEKRPGWGVLVSDARVFSDRKEFMEAVMLEPAVRLRLAVVDIRDKDDEAVAKFCGLVLGADPNMLVTLHSRGPVGDVAVNVLAGEILVERGRSGRVDILASAAMHTRLAAQLEKTKKWRCDRVAYRAYATRARYWPPQLRPPLDWLFSNSISVNRFATAQRCREISMKVNQFAGFDPFELSDNELVVAVCIMFVQTRDQLFAGVDSWSLHEEHLLWLILVVRNCYCSNHYHNFRHAVDVTQAVYYQIHQGIRYPDNRQLDPRDVLGLLLAALGHDIFHPGVTIGTLQEMEGQWPRNHATLEEYHEQIFLQLLAKLWPSVYKHTSEVIGHAIEATEMSRHREYMERNYDRSREGELNWLAQLLKMADISNCSRAFGVSKKHARVLCREFEDEEKLRHTVGLKPQRARSRTPGWVDLHTNLRDPASVAGLQLHFCKEFARPLVETVAIQSPLTSELLDSLDECMGKWAAVSHTGASHPGTSASSVPT